MSIDNQPLVTQQGRPAEPPLEAAQSLVSVPKSLRAVLTSAGAVSAMLWGFIYCAAAFTGQRFEAGLLETSWQLLPIDELTAHPVHSIWYMHIQPPLWNAIVGFLGRWSPLPIAFSLQLLMLASGMLLAWSIASILQKLGTSYRSTIAITLFASANSGVLMFGFRPVYELPIIALVALIVHLAGMAFERRSPVLAVSIAGTILVMTRSLYHPIWLVLLIALMAWSLRHHTSRRSLTIALLVPLIVVGGWAGKNQIMFGRTSLSSWAGMNLLRSISPAIDPADIENLRADGTISEVGALGPFAEYKDYEPLVPTCVPSHSEDVLDHSVRVVTPNAGFGGNNGEVANYNYECFLPIYDQAGQDALAMIRARPGAWVKARYWSVKNWFEVISPREPETSPVVRTLNRLTNFGLVAVAHPPTPSFLKERTLLAQRGPISLVLIVATIILWWAAARHLWLLIRSRSDHITRSLIIAVGGMITAWTFVVGVVGELGEQPRFRNLVDPIVIAIAGALAAQWLSTRTRARWRVRLHRKRTVPAAALALSAGLLIISVGEGAARQRVITDVRPDQTLPTPVPPTSPSAVLPKQKPVCHRFIHLGDSNLAIASQLFQDQWSQLGIEAKVDFAVARAATSTLYDTDTTALEAIAQYRATVPPENRCWIIALGSEDAVLSVRNNSNPALPIQQMVDALAGEPTLWITPVLASATTEFTLDASTAYNRALLKIAATHPSMVVFDWQSIALQHLDQFQLDGAHYFRPLYDLLVQQVADQVSLAWELRE